MTEIILQHDDALAYVCRNWHPDPDKLFAKVLGVEWRGYEMLLGGKMVKMPRFVHVFDEEVPEIWDIRDCLKDIGHFNSCIGNMYTSGAQYIGYHHDKELRSDNIVSLTLGATRDFCLKNMLTKEVTKFKLNHGDLFVMQGSTNRIYKHSVPKRARVTDCRVVLVYRLLE